LGSVRAAIVAALLLSIYRLFLIPGKVKLSTITKEYSGVPLSEEVLKQLGKDV
jgi:hypothetical protein